MRAALTGRLATPSVVCRANVGHRSRVLFQTSRKLSQTSRRSADESRPTQPETKARQSPSPARKQAQTHSLLDSLYGTSQSSTPPQTSSNAMENLSQSLIFQALGKSGANADPLSGVDSKTVEGASSGQEHEPFHFHIYSHKHNTHVTCTEPNRNAIISMSCGNIGFRKSKRGSFDAAYSLTKYVLERLIHMGWPPKMNRLEIVTRGFGKGREAAIKVLMSPEGKILRDKIIRVSDSTRIKYAGTRSKRQRRL